MAQQKSSGSSNGAIVRYERQLGQMADAPPRGGMNNEALREQQTKVAKLGAADRKDLGDVS